MRLNGLIVRGTRSAGALRGRSRLMAPGVGARAFRSEYAEHGIWQRSDLVSLRGWFARRGRAVSVDRSTNPDIAVLSDNVTVSSARDRSWSGKSRCNTSRRSACTQLLRRCHACSLGAAQVLVRSHASSIQVT